ncbi:hypothetical protein D3C78_1368770 [compost metagenome]
MPAFIHQIKSEAIQTCHHAAAPVNQQGHILFHQFFPAFHLAENSVNVSENQPVQQRHGQQEQRGDQRAQCRAVLMQPANTIAKCQ